jgi:hypothetical protein
MYEQSRCRRIHSSSFHCTLVKPGSPDRLLNWHAC